MPVISTNLGNPQCTDVAVETALPFIGNAVRQDLQSTLGQVDPELSKLFEDRNVLLTQGGEISYSADGTTLSFTEDLFLEINSQVAGGTPTLIDLGPGPYSFPASGTMLYAVIDRIGGTAVVTQSATTLPAVVYANQEVFLIAKRDDSGDGIKRCYFRDGYVMDAGTTARLGEATAPPIPTSSTDLKNLGLSSSVGSNALTVNLTQFDGASVPTTGNSVIIGFDNANGSYSTITQTSSLSLTAPAGSTFGLQSGVNQSLYVYAVDNGGTLQLALSASAGNVIDEGELQDTSLLTGTATLSSYPYGNLGGGAAEVQANDDFVSQTFAADSSGPLSYATFNLSYDVSAPTGTLVVGIYSDSGGNPGSLLETSSSVNAATLTNTFATYTFNFTGATDLVAGTVYHLVLNTSGVTFSGTNGIIIAGDDTAVATVEDATSNSTEGTSSPSTWYGQAFTVGADPVSVNYITLTFSATGGTPSGQLTANIYTSSGGFPGSLLATSDNLDVSSFNATPAAIQFQMTSAPILSANTQYFIVVNYSSVTFSGSTIFLNSDSTGAGYPAGFAVTTTNSGSSWSSLTPANLTFTADMITGPTQYSVNSGSSWTSTYNVSFEFSAASNEGSSNNSLLYSSSALSDVPVRLIGRLTVNESTIGEWATAPSAIALQPFWVDPACIIGETKSGYVTEAQFQAQNGYGWVLCDGRNVSGSAYSLLTGNDTIPDERGTFPRMKDNGRGLDPNGDLPLGTYEADVTASHTHAVQAYHIQNAGSATVSAVMTTDSAGLNGAATTQDTGGMATGNPGSETAPKATVKNVFIRINY